MISLAEQSWGANRWASDFVAESGLDSDRDGRPRHAGNVAFMVVSVHEGGMTFVTKTAR
jgi:hypothetical protein